MIKAVLNIIFLLIIAYFVYEFVRVLAKMKSNIILPVSEKEMDAIRKQPQRKLDMPTYKDQRAGIIMYAVILLVTLGIFFVGNVFQLFDYTIYLLLLFPLASSFNLFNMFAVAEDGLLSGGRFIPWSRVKYFEFKRIDVNHRFYGHAKVVNGAYELKIKTNTFPESCVVITEEMKKELEGVLRSHLKDGENDV